MKPHRLDPLSLVPGIFFGVIALVFLFGDIDATDIEARWMLPLPFLFVGLLIAAIGIRRLQPRDEEPIETEPIDTEPEARD
jgi:hypothetical protein